LAEFQGTQDLPLFDAMVAKIAASGLIASAQLEAALKSAAGDWHALAKSISDEGTLSLPQLEALHAGQINTLRIGNYEILGRLGAGGMGTVFKARHRRMKRIVALKVLSPGLSKNAAFVQRFQREVETIARLGHPNIVMAYDADEADEGHFLVMEFINGRDLASIVEREGAMPVCDAVDCILQSARGLAYAHSQAIVHRDIKPANLLRDEGGSVKVTDLGLARLAHGADTSPDQFAVTMAGGVIGTADYMSPEQAVDSTMLDHRTDIYSLGATLHFLLTGRPPYVGPTIIAILLKHRDAPIPSLCEARNDVPAALDEVFRGMLAKTVTDRIQDMGEVVKRLEEIAAGLQGRPPAEIPPGVPQASSPTVASARTSVALSRPLDQTVDLSAGEKASHKSILIVEPSRAQAALFRTYLQEGDFQVVGAATTGADAIALVRNQPPDVVISAMHLRDTTGIQLADQIRSEATSGAPGFILITSDSDETDTSGISRLRRVQILHKPFTADQLKEAISLVAGTSVALSPAATSQLKGTKEEKPDRSRLSVLIVDDSSTARIHERMTLQGLGFSGFSEVADGAQAIAAATRESFDLIITDYNMPLMDGRALVSYLKQNPPTAKTPIVMVTTETDPKILDPVRALGVVAIVEKAFSRDVVAPILDRLF
jgi:serine/threonine protein kinase